MVDEPSAVVSLSSSQVATLLRALNEHRVLLDVAHQDARRLALQATRPAYLVDFELVYRYMFRGNERPEWEQELRYLFDLPDTTFIIGPGTWLEMDRLKHYTGFLPDAEGNLQDLHAMVGRARLDESALTFGMQRLQSLVESSNFQRYQDIVSPLAVDEEALETARAALDKRRPNASEGANEADAINWAAVIHMRRQARALGLDFHPYLLTATRPLLDERSWSVEVTAPVSREPSEAIYSEILLKVFRDPVEAQNHTVEMAFEAAKLERDLRKSPAYRQPQHFAKAPRWKRAVRYQLVTAALRDQLRELADFVTDPVVVETQRVYDNARLATVNAQQQNGAHLAKGSESPQKLFDLIVGVNAALLANQKGSGLASLWSSALAIDTSVGDSRVTHLLVEKSARRRPYLIIEEYFDPPGVETSMRYALRWPSSVNAEACMRLFSRAFERHDVDVVQLAVGTLHEVEHFGADVPFSLAEVIDALEPGHDPQAAKEARWIRAACKEFDLYADLLRPNPGQDPIMGLFVAALDPDHIADLFIRTSARYIFPEWLQEALEAICERIHSEAPGQGKREADASEYLETDVPAKQ